MSPVDDRRSPFGDRWLQVLSDLGRPATFDDLAEAAGSSTRYSDVVRWLSRSLASELIEDAGFEHDASGRPIGPRRYALTARGAALVAHDRRRRLALM